MSTIIQIECPYEPRILESPCLMHYQSQIQDLYAGTVTQVREDLASSIKNVFPLNLKHNMLFVVF